MLITDIRVLKPELLTAIMRANDVLGEYEAVEKIRLAKKGETNGTLFYHLALQYKDYRTQRHAPDKVFLKLKNPADVAEDSIKREVDFYNKVLPAMLRKNKIEDLCLVPVYDAYFDDITGQGHIILDDISADYKPAREKHPPTQRHREQIFDALARIHAHWWEHPILENLAPVPTEDSLNTQLAARQEKYEAMQNFTGTKLMAARHKDILKQISTQIPPRRKERLINGQGITINHHDLNPDNLLYFHRESRIVNWESWQIDTATDDLAYLMACFWPQHLRDFQEQTILRRYYDAVVRYGVTDYSWDDLQYDYRASIAHCIGFMLAGWSKDRHVRGYWQRAELALDAFDKMGAVTIFE